MSPLTSRCKSSPDLKEKGREASQGKSLFWVIHHIWQKGRAAFEGIGTVSFIWPLGIIKISQVSMPTTESGAEPAPRVQRCSPDPGEGLRGSLMHDVRTIPLQPIETNDAI